MIIKEIKDNVGIITLNREDKINALNYEMFIDIEETLKEWENLSDVKVILFDGAGQRGFCSGGDLKEFYEAFLTNPSCLNKHEFFSKEVLLDKYIMSYKKPIISHWFGIVMGGGVGLSIHSDIIITDETTKWAMPETKLGFVPDVSVGKNISTLPQALGQYVGLTGAILEASDLMRYNFSHIFCRSDNYQKLIRELFKVAKENPQDKIIEKFKEASKNYNLPIRNTYISQNMDKIEKYFSKNSVKEIYKDLKDNFDDSFAYKNYHNLKIRSPLMLNVQFEKYFMCKNLSAEQTIDLDLHILNYATDNGDVAEGIRATMIDKDENPTWSVKSIDDVDMKIVMDILNEK